MKTVENLIEKINHILYLENFSQKPDSTLLIEFYELYKVLGNDLTNSEKKADAERIMRKYILTK
jgi:hypothetical protein